MRKLVGLMAAVAAVSSVAGAQTWQGQNGTFKLDGCYKDGQYILCEVSYTLTKLDTMRSQWEPEDVSYFLSNGTSGKASSVSVAGKNFVTYSTSSDIINGVPIKVVFGMGLPSNTASIRALVISGHRIDNVPVRGNAPAPAPAAATAPANTNAYNAVMTNCKAGANGTLTCTATLTPRR